MNKIKKNQNEKKYMILIIGIIVIQAVRYFPFKFGGWNQIQLSFNYSYGFIQRAFLGSVLDLVSKLFHIPWGYMRYIYGIVTMFTFSLLLLVILYRCLLRTHDDENMQKFFMGMGILFFMGPGWNTQYSNFALTDVWMVILSGLGAYVIYKGKTIWLTFLISIICILIHPAYVFLYFNVILVAFTYKFICDKSDANKKYIGWGVVTLIIDSILFIYMMFFAHAKEGITIEYVMQRTAEFVNKSVEEIQNHETTISGYLFREGDVSGVQMVISQWWLILVVMIILFLPFIFEVCRYWKNVVSASKETESNKWWIYACMPFGIVTSIPIYLMHNDYGRWTYAVFFYEFSLIWILNMIKDNNIMAATQKLLQRIKINKVYYMVLLFYATVLGAFEQNLVSPLISTIESYCWKIIELL